MIFFCAERIFYQMSVKLTGQHYVTFSFIKPCLKSLQVEMEALCLDYEESDFKTVRKFLNRAILVF
jgi:hypothetical protein